MPMGACDVERTDGFAIIMILRLQKDVTLGSLRGSAVKSVQRRVRTATAIARETRVARMWRGKRSKEFARNTRGGRVGVNASRETSDRVCEGSIRSCIRIEAVQARGALLIWATGRRGSYNEFESNRPNSIGEGCHLGNFDLHRDGSSGSDSIRGLS